MKIRKMKSNLDERQELKLLKIEPNTIGKYGYYRYLIYPNLTPDGQKIYQEKMGTKKNGEFYEQTAERLTGLMKSLMFKRFESSIYSFKQTLERQITSLSTLVDMLENGKVYIPMKNLSNLEAYYEALESGGENGIYRQRGNFQVGGSVRWNIRQRECRRIRRRSR